MRYLEEPAKTLTDPRELLLGYVEAYRNAMRRKVADARERAVRPPAAVGMDAARAAQAPRLPPTLGWIFCHVLQEYARHLGHLDVVIELAGGSTGE